ncbi:MAG: anaerobic ribonucleoside-triphosphate reductase activating protein [Bacilli bacterium]|nr:anaerobic ribonucleoside-triphosphate reductase activating protein [Bacilli bacterium]MDD4795903.1 anaerobic ribonucleoside-triphosphate reductase activating protein [Bacilli bacterium]
MNISGLEKLSVTDYPGYVSCIVFTQGCNFNCLFCHNSSLIPFKKGSITEEEVLAYIEKRKNILDGVVITGGEPLLQSNIKEFIKKIKKIGLKVKLDTNGSNYTLLKELIDNDLIDYIAMDIKSDMTNYEQLTGFKKNNFDSIKDTIKLIENSNIDYEFRTTIIKEYHNLDNIINICKLINPKSKYYLQNYIDSENVLTKGLSGFTKEELQNMENKLREKYSNVKVRGL